MFDIGWSEILILAVVTIIVVGPKDLPRLLKNLGQIARKLRQTANEFRGHIDDVIRDAELDDIKSAVDNVKGLNPLGDITKSIDKEVQSVRDIVTDIDIDNHNAEKLNEEPYEELEAAAAASSKSTAGSRKSADKSSPESVSETGGDSANGTLKKGGDQDAPAKDPAIERSAKKDMPPKSAGSGKRGKKAASGRG